MTGLATSKTLPNIDAPSLDKLEAACYLGISPRTVDRLRAKGALGYTRVAGQVRFSWRELMMFALRNEVVALTDET